MGEIAGQDELVRLAERAAHEARQSGVDPRELAALLYAARASADLATGWRSAATCASRSNGPRAPAGRLEAELALLEESPPPLPEPARPRGARPVPDCSAPSSSNPSTTSPQQVGELRRQLAEARDRDGGARPASSVPSGAPESVVSGGSWTLRWRL